VNEREGVGYVTPKLLVLDIEMRPCLAWVWQLKADYIPPQQVKEPKRLLCFSWKWLGEAETHFASEWTEGSDGMAHILYTLLDEADIVCGWNSRRFDVPVCFTEIMLAGLNPPSPFQHLDLLLGMRKRFHLMSNRLGEVAKILGTSRKLENSGFQLWVDVMDGKAEARVEMEEYNRADVEATEAIYLRLKAWWPSHPNVALMAGDEFACPACGSQALRARGIARTAVSEFRRYHCQDCGKWSRETRRRACTTIREIA